MTTVELVLDEEHSRGSLVDWLESRFAVERHSEPTLEKSADLCIVDQASFLAHAGRLSAWKDREPGFSPVVLVDEDPVGDRLDSSDWVVIDGVAAVPIETDAFERRLDTMLEQRRYSLQGRLGEERPPRADGGVEANDTVTWLLDARDRTLESVDPAIEQYVNADRERVLAEPLQVVLGRVHPEDRGRLAAALADLFEDVDAGDPADSYEFEFRLTDPEDAVRWIEATATPVSNGGDATHLLGAFEDVTERRQRERRFSAVFNQTFQFTALLAPDGTILDINDAALSFIGQSEDDVLGTPLWETSGWSLSEGDRDRLREAIERAGDGEFIRSEEQVRGVDGLATIDFSLKPVTDETGEVTLLVAAGRYISDLKRRERKLQRQNGRLEEFAGIVSHDLRNPLQVIIARLDLLEDEASGEFVEDMQRATDRMERLIEDLLTLARQGETVSDLEPTSLSTAAWEAWDTVDAPESSLTVEDDVVLAVDRNRLAQLFENLFRNSVEHGPPEGVSIRVGVITDPPGSVGDETVREVRGFYVADDGPGIPAGEREKVFDVGYSTREEGTGFGLNIVADVAAAHGWSVDVIESVSGGARFEITEIDAQ